MICISRRRRRISPALAAVKLRPANAIVPAVGSMRRNISRPSVLLPEPDSPTRPKVSPSWMSSDTASTARTSPAAPPNMDSPSGYVLLTSRASTNATVGSLTQSDHRHGSQRSQNADSFPARKVFSKKHARQQHRDCRIERAQHHGRIQPSGLTGADEQRGSAGIEYSGKHAEQSISKFEIAFSPANENDSRHRRN